MDDDVKMQNGDEEKPSTVEESASNPNASSAMAVEGDAEPMETDAVPPSPAVCHNCYYQRIQEHGQPVLLDLSSPILVA